jgi:putative ABC transport system permease protein
MLWAKQTNVNGRKGQRSNAATKPGGSVRTTGGPGRRLRIFAVTQIAASFLLLAGASMLLKTLIVLPSAQTGLDTDHVLALNVPVMT